VVSLSHGGLPTASWATAVNRLYEAGIVLVAAAGDSYQGPLGAFPTHQTCYPSAFNRVITATGITFDGLPYKSESLGELQGCWGPDSVLRKSVAAPAPNVPWMLANTLAGWDNDGAGTSASTPQIAAACALWLAQYGARFHAGWQRVAACRRALLTSLVPSANPDEIGAGQLDSEAMMAADLADLITAGAGQLEYIPPDTACFPLLRLLFSLPAQATGEMCETEALQLVFTSPDTHFRDLVRQNFDATSVDSGTATYLRSSLLGHPEISNSLRAYLSKPVT
jgi:subtilisin family serine protease